MRLTDAYANLQRMDRPVIETREAAVRLALSTPTASKLLCRLEQSRLVRRLRRGLWVLDPGIEPFAVSRYLTAPFPAYVSFWSALARHGMIEQIPRQISVASLGRTRKIKTSIGEFSIHHLAPELFGGYRQIDEGGHLATPEKALFDTVYLLTPRGGQIHLPELELTDTFTDIELEGWTDRIANPRIRTLVRRGLDSALAAAQR